MPDTRTAHAERTQRVLRWAERVLLGTGVVFLGGAGLVVADAWVAQGQARRALAAVRAPAVVTPPTLEWPETADVQPAAALVAGEPVARSTGAPIGELSIPRVQLAAVVLHGTDARTLRHGPGHIPGTALPGEPGTVAIAGHRDSFFRPIRNVRLGDDIFLDTPRGRFGYRVSSLRIVGPNDVSVLSSADAGGTLTLITCYPFSLAGPAPDRFVVTATEVRRPDGGVPPDESGRATVGDDREKDRAPQDVRSVIARFQAGYNGRLTRHPEADARPLNLRDCVVTMDVPVATATCSDPTPPANRTGLWLFTLRPVAGSWNIASVESR